MSEDNGGSKIGIFLAGMGIGAIVALLFAPRTGDETRDLIVQKAGEGRDYVKAKSEEIRQQVKTKSEEIRQQAEDAVEKGKDLVNKQKELLSAALEAGKQAYQEEKVKAK